MNNSTFDVRQQRAFMDRHSDSVRWFPARKCACSDDPNRADPNCRVCRGLGYFYRAYQTIRGLVGSISSQKMLLESGIALPGDMVFTEDFMPRERLSDMDMVRLTLDRGQPYEGDLIVRGTGAVDDLVYLASDIIDCYQVSPVSGGITTFSKGTDFLHTSGTTAITWQAAAQPEVGSTYGVKYNAIFDWLVFTPPNDRFERGTSLGNRVLLRKKHTVLANRNQ